MSNQTNIIRLFCRKETVNIGADLCIYLALLINIIAYRYSMLTSIRNSYRLTEQPYITTIIHIFQRNIFYLYSILHERFGNIFRIDIYIRRTTEFKPRYLPQISQEENRIIQCLKFPFDLLICFLWIFEWYIKHCLPCFSQIMIFSEQSRNHIVLNLKAELIIIYFRSIRICKNGFKTHTKFSNLVIRLRRTPHSSN